MVSLVTEPVDPAEVRRLVRDILGSGTVSFSRHALSEMANDNLTAVDCTNAMRGGVVEPGEFDKGSWRYRIHTARMCVVVAFRSEVRLAVVTAWRVK